MSMEPFVSIQSFCGILAIKTASYFLYRAEWQALEFLAALTTIQYSALRPTASGIPVARKLETVCVCAVFLRHFPLCSPAATLWSRWWAEVAAAVRM